VYVAALLIILSWFILQERETYSPFLKLHTIAKHQLFGMGIEVNLVRQVGNFVFAGMTFDQCDGFC